MKKYVLVLCTLLLLCGCGKKEEKVKTDLKFDEDSYSVYEPYKSGVSNDYVVSHILNHYDREEVESSLMDISTSYFPTDNTYYQAGQYLTEKDLTNLLSKEKLNQADTVTIDGISISPEYISYIYEQNYLSSEGKLKGVSIAVVLNPYQQYQNQYGAYQYKKVDESIVLEFGKKRTQELLTYLREEKNLKDVKILLGLYVQNGPDEVLPGSFKQVGITSSADISFQSVDYQYQLLESNWVQEKDMNSYTAFQNLKKKLAEVFPTTYMVAEGLYVSGRLQNLEIDVHSTYMNKSELLKISQLISTELSNTFPGGIQMKVYLKENNDMVGFISKEKTSSSARIYIMKG